MAVFTDPNEYDLEAVQAFASRYAPVSISDLQLTKGKSHTINNDGYLVVLFRSRQYLVCRVYSNGRVLSTRSFITVGQTFINNMENA